MRMEVRQFLGSLKERDELDFILPDVLSELGLKVFRRPGRGAGQKGVDVGAFGKMPGDDREYVYLLTIKPGDITRRTWAATGESDIKPSVEEVLEAYIPSRLPAQYKNYEKVVVICIGGEVREEVQDSIRGFCRNKRKREGVFVNVWDGDHLAAIFSDRLRQEEVALEKERPKLRGALALVSDGEASSRYFYSLIDLALEGSSKKKAERARVIRRINLYLHILYGWSREEDNLESAYLSAERALVRCWSLLDPSDLGKWGKTKVSIAILELIETFLLISSDYIGKIVFPYSHIRDGLSRSVPSSQFVDVNIKMFDLLSRLAVHAIWVDWLSDKGLSASKEYEEIERYKDHISDILKLLISNNGVLYSPILERQTSVVQIVGFFFSQVVLDVKSLKNYIGSMLELVSFSVRRRKYFVASPASYEEILEVVDEGGALDQERFEELTGASVFYPVIGMFSGRLGMEEQWELLEWLQKNVLEHSTMQIWYASDSTFKGLFEKNPDIHGRTLVGVDFSDGVHRLEELISLENRAEELSAESKFLLSNYLPVVFTALRHWEKPIPAQVMMECLAPQER